MTVWVVVVETDSDDTGYLKSIVGVYSTQTEADTVAAQESGTVEAFDLDAPPGSD